MLRMLVLITALIWTAESACGQGLRISTQVFEVTTSADNETDSRVISSSLSLCHNGRVYDYVDSADEVVIFDPTERRFAILNPTRRLTTSLSFDEIRQLLETRAPKTEAYLQELLRSGEPTAEKTVRSIRFQLNPEFKESFDPMKGQLLLTSPSFTYRVQTRRWNDAKQVERYLTCTDWTARLNSIMHPSSLFPEPRMALNQALRRLGDRMPVSVELDLRPNDSLRLRADHQLTQNLGNDDHARIARWEEMIRSPEVRQVSFRSYQEAVLVSQSR